MEAKTLFTEVSYDLGALISSIELGEVGLPDIQRPFVWPNARIRDLFDSMYRGYPVGYFLFWKNAVSDDARAVGSDFKQKPPQLLIVDGQQRLTSLYAVLKGIPVVRENYSTERIEIAFNPLLQVFAVADAAIRRDRSYISDISVMWKRGADIFGVAGEYLEGLRATREVTVDEVKKINAAISKLHSLTYFPFRALELSATVSEEQVAEVFVRINSKGKTLNQADFILTLMSVFWDQGRRQLEEFCRTARTPSLGQPSPFNHLIQPDPDQLLRVSVAVAFKRGKMQSVYNILRGKDLDTEEFSTTRRDDQFEVLKSAQAKVLNLQHWHDFLKAIAYAGYRSQKMITSQGNLIFAYILFLIGRTEFNVEASILRKVIARWFFMSGLTSRFANSPESKMEFDLARLRTVTSAEEFISVLHRICDETITNDFWQITLPNELATSAARSPSLFAFYASLILNDAKVLFSDVKVAELLDPAIHANREALERHHLFPKNHLHSLGIKEQRDTNQIANYALVEWHDNGKIKDSAPSDYLPLYLEKVGNKRELECMHRDHALPDGWERMAYPDFLEKRRELIAAQIKRAYESLAPIKASVPAEVTIAELIKAGETKATEFKATLRTNLHTGQADPKMEQGVLKTIAGMLNSTAGGTLIVGVMDDGVPIGIEADGFPDEDKMNLHLANLIGGRIGAAHSIYIHPRFEDYEDVRVLVVECWPARSPVFVKDGSVERFYVRSGTSTAELSASQVQQFVKERF
jgi:hypothetical protein